MSQTQKERSKYEGNARIEFGVGTAHNIPSNRYPLYRVYIIRLKLASIRI